jgi:predicted RNA methylase
LRRHPATALVADNQLAHCDALQYDLPKTMAFHKKATLDIQVDFWRFSRIRKP